MQRSDRKVGVKSDDKCLLATFQIKTLQGLLAQRMLDAEGLGF